MANLEKHIAEAVLEGSSFSPAKLGLRFDRVVARVLRDLRAYAESAAPAGVTVLVSISAPIRLPAKTVEIVRVRIRDLLATRAHGAVDGATVHGNAVSLRLVREAACRRPKLVGFVHNPGSDPGQLLDLAERWLRG